MSRERIILDIDNATGMPGRDVDDGLALAMALISKEVDLLGVTTCGGNCHAYESTDITLRMLALADRADVPVAAGRDLPILQDVSAHYEFLDNVSAGANALWANAVSLPAFEGEAPVLPAHQFIISTSSSSEGRGRNVPSPSR